MIFFSDTTHFKHFGYVDKLMSAQLAKNVNTLNCFEFNQNIQLEDSDLL